MRINAVVVAYNRRELLLENLAAITGQTFPVDAIVVVDNASTDGSADAVMDAFPSVDLVQSAHNTGGAGGFAVGLARALEAHKPDLIWIMDDDTIPTPTALEELLSARDAQPTPAALLASRVVWTDGTDHPMNTPRPKPFAGMRERREARNARVIPIRSASFVSSLVDAARIRAVGLPIAEYFIWNDDFEFTARVLRAARGVYVPASVVIHKTKALADTDVDPGDRFYFEVRNKLWLFRYSRALRWWEKPMYMAAAARRWIRTAKRSTDRDLLRRAFSRGWRDGFRSHPLTNSGYLSSLGVESASIEQFDRSPGAP